MQEADSNSTPRLRRLPRSARRALVFIAPLVALCVGAAPVALGSTGLASLGSGTADASGAASDATAAVAEPAAEIELNVAPLASTSVDPAAPQTSFTVEVVNRSGAAVADGTIVLSVPGEPLGDATAVSDWLGDGATPAVTAAGESPSHSLPMGGVGLVSVPTPAEALAPQVDSPIIAVRAELVVDGAAVAATDAVFPSTRAEQSGSVSLTVVGSITVPAETTGLIDADQLTTWTSSTGLLTRQLDALADRPVAIAIDPRIIASIRVLGANAPESALEWLERLAAVTNETFPLTYADSDLALQSQLGVGVLQPTSFADALDPANFPAEGGQDEDAEPSATPSPGASTGTGTGTATPSPSATGAPVTESAEASDPSVEATEPAVPTDPADTVPTTDDLLAWPYTRTDVAWPADGTVAAGDLAVFRAAGLTTSILSSSNVEPAGPDASAASNVDGETALVADGAVTGALRDAASATTDTAEREAVGRLLASLSLRSATAGSQATLLATLQRGAQTNAVRVASVLDQLALASPARTASFSEAVGAPPTGRTLVSLPEGDPRVSYADRLLGAEGEVAEFASVLDDPTLLTAPNRRQLLSLLDIAWMQDDAGWGDAVGTWLVAQTQTLNAVSVVPSSNVLIVASETGVPTTVQNTLPYPVTVFVDVSPSNGRLIVDERVQVTVAPASRGSVRVPVEAGVGNGDVTLTVALTSTTGVQIGRPVDIPATVHADWEGLGAVILGALLVAFFGIGVWRNIRRRRRERAAVANESDAPVATDAPAESDAPASTPHDAERRDG